MSIKLAASALLVCGTSTAASAGCYLYTSKYSNVKGSSSDSEPEKAVEPTVEGAPKQPVVTEELRSPAPENEVSEPKVQEAGKTEEELPGPALDSTEDSGSGTEEEGESEEGVSDPAPAKENSPSGDDSPLGSDTGDNPAPRADTETPPAPPGKGPQAPEPSGTVQSPDNLQESETPDSGQGQVAKPQGTPEQVPTPETQTSEGGWGLVSTVKRIFSS